MERSHLYRCSKPLRGRYYLHVKSASPNPSGFADGAEDVPTPKFRSACPCIDSRLYPAWHRNRPHVPTFPDEVREHPVLLSTWKMRLLGIRGFGTRTARSSAGFQIRTSQTPKPVSMQILLIASIGRTGQRCRHWSTDDRRLWLLRITPDKSASRQGTAPNGL